MSLGMEVDLDSGHIMLHGVQLPLPGNGHSSPLLFGPCLLWSNGRPSQLLLSSCFVYFVVTRGKLSSLSSQSAIFCIR